MITLKIKKNIIKLTQYILVPFFMIFCINLFFYKQNILNSSIAAIAILFILGCLVGIILMYAKLTK